jgi:ABC-2 type transport system ATP-binding protein
MGHTTVADVNDLSRSFGHKAALDGVSFNATAGHVHGLVGANGAGKTTLLKHLLGLLRAHTGSVRVFGRDPVRDPVGVLSRIGYLSEERELPEWMRVDELMDYTRAFHPTHASCSTPSRWTRPKRSKSFRKACEPRPA